MNGSICWDAQMCTTQASTPPLHSRSNPMHWQHVPWEHFQPFTSCFNWKVKNELQGCQVVFSWGAAAHRSHVLAYPTARHYRSWVGDFGRCTHYFWQLCQQLKQGIPEVGGVQKFWFAKKYFVICNPTKKARWVNHMPHFPLQFCLPHQHGIWE